MKAESIAVLEFTPRPASNATPDYVAPVMPDGPLSPKVGVGNFMASTWVLGNTMWVPVFAQALKKCPFDVVLVTLTKKSHQ